eukprot:g40557.t1
MGCICFGGDPPWAEQDGPPHPIYGRPDGLFAKLSDGMTHYVFTPPSTSPPCSSITPPSPCSPDAAHTGAVPCSDVWVVLAHGLGGSHHVWDKFDSVLHQRYPSVTTLRYDYYGMGHSVARHSRLRRSAEVYTRQVFELLSHVADKQSCGGESIKIIWVGYSTGCCVGVEFAAMGGKAAERFPVQSMFLISPAVRPVPKAFLAKLTEIRFFTECVRCFLMRVANRTYRNAVRAEYTDTAEGKEAADKEVKKTLQMHKSAAGRSYSCAVVETSYGMLSSGSLHHTAAKFMRLAKEMGEHMHLCWAGKDVTTPYPSTQLENHLKEAKVTFEEGLENGKHAFLLEKATERQIMASVGDFVINELTSLRSKSKSSR